MLKYSHPDPDDEILKFIDIQFNQQHNPIQMAKNYPLSSVPEDAILIKDKCSGVVNGDMGIASASASGGGCADASRSDSSLDFEFIALA